MIDAIFPVWEIAPRDMLAAARNAPIRAPREATSPRGGGRPLVLIVVDARRRDRIGIYNSSLQNTPFLSKLEREGHLRKFEAYSTCTFSFCGIMSIVASRSWNDFGTRPVTLIDWLTQVSYKAHLILSGQHSSFGGLINVLGGAMSSIVDQPLRQQPDDRPAIQALQVLRVEDPRRSFVYMHLISAHVGAFIEPPYRVTPNDNGVLGAYLFGATGKAAYSTSMTGGSGKSTRSFAALSRF